MNKIATYRPTQSYCRCGDPKRNTNNGNIQANATREPAKAVQTEDYDAWGLSFGSATPSGSVSGAEPSRYLYNGKEQVQDLNIGLYEYGFRWYDAQTAKFVQVDPMTDKIPKWSGYSYTLNNPLIYIDKDGLIPIPISSGDFRKYAISLGLNGNQEIGQFFENLAIASLRTTHPQFLSNTSLNFHSKIRENLNNGLPNKVRPDALNFLRPGFELDKNVKMFISPEFVEAKATKASITIKYRKAQITGMVDVISKLLNEGKYGSLLLITTSNTKINDDILKYATKKHVAIFQSIAAIDDETGEFIISDKKVLNYPLGLFFSEMGELFDSLIDGKFSRHEEYKGIDPKKYLKSQNKESLNTDPDPAQIDDK